MLVMKTSETKDIDAHVNNSTTGTNKHELTVVPMLLEPSANEDDEQRENDP